MENWYLYILECKDNSYYCGITKNINKRLYEHNHTKKASKYVKARRPVKLIYTSFPLDQHSALIYEKKIKKLNKIQKINFINSSKISIKDFFE